MRLLRAVGACPGPVPKAAASEDLRVGGRRGTDDRRRSTGVGGGT